MSSAFALDADSRKRRLQALARTPDFDPKIRSESPPSFATSTSGLPVLNLGDDIRRADRDLEAELTTLDPTESTPFALRSTIPEPMQGSSKVRLIDSQLRMASWLNELPIKKYVTFFPEVANAHATVVVR